ncbi:MAG TPA: hypothetical protein VM186_09200 [Planctomycetota bacterium]|nr:hypothetical protein [Planctomycetota bacterium]
MISSIVMIALAIGASAAPPPSDGPLRALLGADYAGARIVGLGGQRGKSVIAFALASPQPRTLISFDDDERRITVNRPYWSPDGRQVIVSYDGKCWVLKADGSANRRILQDENVGEASFWKDPKTGELCVVYCRTTGKDKRGNVTAETRLYRPSAGANTAKLADGMFNAGLSRDGTHLGNAGGGVQMRDLVTGTTSQLNVRTSACNASMSPDDTYRIMHLYAPHRFFGIRDEWDHELWRMEGLNGGDWGLPRWSNHPDFCTVFGRGLYVVKISTKEAVPAPRNTLHGYAHLWLPSAAAARPPKPGPIDHLKLDHLAAYRKKLADSEDYSRIIDELSRSSDPEAKLIVAELEDQAQQKMARALAEEDPLKFLPDIRELGARFRSRPIGIEAAAMMQSAEFKREEECSVKLYGLQRHKWSLRPVPGAQSVFGDPVFLERYRGTLAQMVEPIAPARNRYQGTKSLMLMERIAKEYGLPERTAEPGNTTISFIGAISKVSHVPTLAEIAPYDDALTYVRYRIQEMVTGDYAGKEIIVAHYVIKDKKETDAAKWQPGHKQLLTVDRLDAHPKLEELPAADEANDLGLVPYSAVKVVNW